MKPQDKDKLNECLKILDTTDLGLSLVWLWTWSTIKNFENDTDWKMVATEDEMWEHLGEAVEAGMGFTLEYGAEQHYEDVMQWMLSREYMIDLNDDREKDEDEDE